MATSGVYSSTTVSNPKSSCFTVPSENLDKQRFIIKVLEVLLSFVAFILEEVVNSCISCNALYFFEFVSCTAFLFTLLLLVLLSTPLHTKVGINCWPRLDFVYTAVIAVLLLISSIVFAAESNTTIEKSAVAFGFLATILFVADLFLFWKKCGFPFQRSEKQQATNGGPATLEAHAETEKLATPATGE